ncbi:MAG: PKD domain-containing protein [Bacteroidia bacterium]
MMSQWLYGVSKDHDSIWAIDTTTWNVAQRKQLSLVVDSILGCNGLAYDPVGHESYLLLRLQSQPTNVQLATVNLQTAVCSPVGSLNDDFRAIAFREDGQLLGLVGDGGAQAESLFLIDKANGSNTLATALGNGDIGEALAFRPDDGLLYHWSGSINAICEKLPATAPFSPIQSIPLSGSPATEVSAALHLNGTDFLVALADGTLAHQTASGSRGPTLTTAPTPFSGIAMPPRFVLWDASICLSEPAEVLFSGLAADTVVYDWGDSSFTTVYPAGPASHYYQINAYYTLNVILKNPASGPDTVASLLIYVIHLPPVGLFPGLDTVICDVDTVLITGAFGGASQWYRNGQPIPGANTYQYIATQNGWYNMTKTNQLGCTDSAHVGVAIGFASQSIPTIQMDTSDCPTIHFSTNSPVVQSWQWSFGDGSIGFAASPSHTYASVGNYNVGVIVINECGSFSGTATAIVDCEIGVKEPDDLDLEVFPNPGDGEFHLKLSGASGKPVHATVRNLQGQIMLDQVRNPDRLDEAYNFKAAAGAYHLHVETNGKSISRLLMVR